MKNNIFLISLIFLVLTGCIGISSKGVFGTGVSIAFDPRSLGTQIDDSVMQKSLAARLALREKLYIKRKYKSSGWKNFCNRKSR